MKQKTKNKGQKPTKEGNLPVKKEDQSKSLVERNNEDNFDFLIKELN